MNIVVCVKEIFDPEATADYFTIDNENNSLVASKKIQKVLNPFDEHAVEAALRIKDKLGANVTAISLGKDLDRVVTKKPVFMGADELVLLEDEIFNDGDSWSTAIALAAAIRKIGKCDLVLCGRQAADTNAGLVGIGIAEMLGLPHVSVAQQIDVLDGKANVKRVTCDGYETVEISLPAVITVSNEIGLPRYPAVKNIRNANKIQPTVWTHTDIGIDSSQAGKQGRRLKLTRLFQPIREGTCEIVEGETPQEAAENLALALRKAKIL
jgi:electron transfer flavoprotein beta subunit